MGGGLVISGLKSLSKSNRACHELRPYGVSIGLLPLPENMEPSDRITGTSAIRTGEFADDMVSPDVLTVDFWTASSIRKGAPATNCRFLVGDAGGSEEFRERDSPAGRNGR